MRLQKRMIVARNVMERIFRELLTATELESKVFEKLLKVFKNVNNNDNSCVGSKVKESFVDFLKAYRETLTTLNEKEIHHHQLLVILSGLKERLQHQNVFCFIIFFHQQYIPDISNLHLLIQEVSETVSNQVSGNQPHTENANDKCNKCHYNKRSSSDLVEPSETDPSMSTKHAKYDNTELPLPHTLPTSKVQHLTIETSSNAEMGCTMSSPSLNRRGVPSEEMIKRRWFLPTEEEMLQRLSPLYHPTLPITEAIDKVKTTLMSEAEDGLRIKHALQMYHTELPFLNPADEAIVSFLYWYAYIVRMCNKFMLKFQYDRLQLFNADHIKELIPTSRWSAMIECKDNDAKGASTVVHGGFKAGLRKLTTNNLDELVSQLHLALTNQEVHSSSDRPGNTSSSVVGLYSNFHSLVLAYGSYQNGQYEFGFTSLGEELSSRQYLLRLLYVLTLSPDELIEQAKASRDEAAEKALKETKEFDDLLDNDYKALADAYQTTFNDDECDKNESSLSSNSREDNNSNESHAKSEAQLREEADKRFTAYLTSLEVSASEEEEEDYDDDSYEGYDYVVMKF